MQLADVHIYYLIVRLNNNKKLSKNIFINSGWVDTEVSEVVGRNLPI